MAEGSRAYLGEEGGGVSAMTARDVDGAFGGAVEFLAKSEVPQDEPGAVLQRAARLVESKVDDFARTIALEAAKPIKTARVEAQRAVSTLTYSAIEARCLGGEVVPMAGSDAGAGKIGLALRVPIGVVGAITPFNFPLNLVAHKLGPAIAAGAPVVLKPAGSTPLTALAFADLLTEAGLPEGFLHVVTGRSSDVGNPLVEHPAVRYLTFTGSQEVGWGIAARAPKKRVRLELGSASPLIVHGDGDWETAARKTAAAGFSHAGQSCISVQRVYVHRDVENDFVRRFVPAVEELVLGDPLDERTDVSQLITEDDRDRVKQWVDEARTQGASVLTGGEVHDGLLQPTVLGQVRPDMKVVCQEVFGPVVTVTSYDDIEEAFALANGTDLGLNAGIFTTNIGLALRAGRELEFGSVLVNEVPTFRADQMPYGGVKESGNTREGPSYAVKEMTEIRLLTLQG